jgi:hypothetical protein
VAAGDAVVSYSTYYIFSTDGRRLSEHEMRNSHLGVTFIWDRLCRTYLDASRPWIFQVSRFWEEDIDRTLPDDDRFLLHMTYDRALLPRSEFRRAAELLSKLVFKNEQGELRGHWPAVVQLLEDYADREDVLGFGIYATSVSEDVWKEPLDEEGNVEVDARKAKRVIWGSPELVVP